MTNVSTVVINGINTLAGVQVASIFLPLGAKVFGISVGVTKQEIQIEQLKLSNYRNYYSCSINGNNVIAELTKLDGFIEESLGVAVKGVDVFIDVIASESFENKVDQRYVAEQIHNRMQYNQLFIKTNWVGEHTRIINITSTLEDAVYNHRHNSGMIGYIDGVVKSITKSLQFNRIFVNSLLVNTVDNSIHYDTDQLHTLVPSLVYHLVSCDHVTHRYISYKVEYSGKVVMLNSLWNFGDN